MNPDLTAEQKQQMIEVFKTQNPWSEYEGSTYAKSLLTPKMWAIRFVHWVRLIMPYVLGVGAGAIHSLVDRKLSSKFAIMKTLSAPLKKMKVAGFTMLLLDLLIKQGVFPPLLIDSEEYHRLICTAIKYGSSEQPKLVQAQSKPYDRNKQYLGLLHPHGVLADSWFNLLARHTSDRFRTVGNMCMDGIKIVLCFAPIVQHLLAHGHIYGSRCASTDKKTVDGILRRTVYNDPELKRYGLKKRLDKGSGLFIDDERIEWIGSAEGKDRRPCRIRVSAKGDLPVKYLEWKPYSVALCPGGFSEAVFTGYSSRSGKEGTSDPAPASKDPITPNQELAYLKTRTGFMKIAIEHQIDIIPTYSFGNGQMYEETQMMKKNAQVRAQFSQKYFVPAMTHSGKYKIPAFFADPLTEKTVTVTFDPFVVEGRYTFFHHNSGGERVEKSEEEKRAVVKEAHGAYLEYLKRCFDEYKWITEGTEKRELVFVGDDWDGKSRL